jgi:transcriptional regulator with XRE-family HTH domain
MSVSGKEIFERIVKLANLTGKTRADAARFANISEGTISGWQYGTKPSLEILDLLCEFYDVSLDFIAKGITLQGKELSPQALIMAEKYDVLTDKQKQLVDATIDEFLNQEEPKYMEGKEPRATGRGKSA